LIEAGQFQACGQSDIGRPCALKYVYGKTRHVEKNSSGGQGEIMENDRGGEFNIIYLIYYKNFCKCHNIPPGQ
jgi:hypothetical protein